MIAKRRHAAPNVGSKMYQYPPARDEQDAVEEEAAKEP
jgi:hypothetical protein